VYHSEYDYRSSFTDTYGNKGVSISIKNDGGQLILSGEAANGTATKDGTTGLEKGKWYKVGFGFNKNEGTVKIYLDGEEEISFSGLSFNFGMTAVGIGAKYTGSSN
jgi:hypothetical protein